MVSRCEVEFIELLSDSCNSPTSSSSPLSRERSRSDPACCNRQRNHKTEEKGRGVALMEMRKGMETIKRNEEREEKRGL